MNRGPRKTKKSPDALVELEGLRVKLEEAEETLRAIVRGEVDGILVRGSGSAQLYTLKGADESYRTLVETMNEGALILDNRSTILYANRRLADILGLPISRVIGASAGEFIPDESRRAFDAMVAESRTTPRQLEIALRRSDGRLVPVRLSASPAQFEERPCLCVLVTDLTEQKEREAARAAEQRAAQDEILRHSTELEASNRELEAFVYSVSHDLRAPLRHIHRFSTLVQEDYGEGLGEEARAYLSRVTDAAEHMDRLIEGLLGYSRMSRGTIQVRTLPTSSVISEVLRQLSEEAKDSRADIAVDEPLLPVRGDALLLTQAVINLVSNALKFVTPGTHPHIRIRSEARGKNVRLWVEDRGIGISAGHQERLFRVFERLEGHRFPGTGIGLAIVKRAVERMDGRAGVESEVGKGSRFWIELRGTEA